MTRTASILCVLLGLVSLHTWPIARAPGRESLNHNADAQLCAWTMSWIAHALPRDPLHLFDAPIFWPERQTMTYTDPMLPPALVAAPVRWLGGSPVLAFNLTMITGLVLTAAGGAWVAWRWTGSMGGALVAGTLTAFNVHLLTRLPHIVATHAWGLPLAIYFADRLMTAPRRRDVMWLAITIAAIATTSPYLLAMTGVIVVATAVVGAASRAGGLQSAAALAGAAGLGVLAALPIMLPYIRFAASGATRPIEIVSQFSATPSGYLSSASRVHQTWNAPFVNNDVDMFFPGLAAIVLASIGMASLLQRRLERRRALTIVAIAAIGLLLSLGPATFLYRWLYDWVPPLQGLRAAARFGYLFLLSTALLAGIGVAAINARLRTAGARVALAVAVLTTVTVEAWQGPVRTQLFRGVPAIYSLLAEASGPVRLVEVPFFPAEAAFEHGEYVLNSTGHWQPILNGYSGFLPSSFRERAASFWYCPRPFAIDAMKREGATHVMVHLERFEGEASQVQNELLTRDDLRLVAADQLGHRLYEFLAW